MSGATVLPHAWEGSEPRMELATLFALFALVGSVFALLATVVQLLQQRLDRKLASTGQDCALLYVGSNIEPDRAFLERLKLSVQREHLDTPGMRNKTHSCWEVECLKAFNETSPSYHEHTTELYFESARNMRRSYSSQALLSDSSRSSSDSASSWRLPSP